MSRTNSEEILSNKGHSNKKKDLGLFALVIVLGTLVMALMLIFEVSNWVIWYLFLTAWTVVELRIAKNIKLKWWWWVLILYAILMVDYLVMAVV